ncbi:MAG: Holliday junction branch migration protein RuvA [Alphaproteobacteria bacterium]|nr:Holliday junction branch migration protein RuvA [Alphaproteobacteria bacterium]
MIGKLRGLIDSVGEDSVVIDVGGVGYVAFCSANTLRRVPHNGEVILWIETHVREDHIHLYGFIDQREREWFRVLTTVQGVGSRTALALLGVLTADDITHALLTQDKTPFTRASGVGPKLAERIVTELKNKAMVATEGGFAAVSGPSPSAAVGTAVGIASSTAPSKTSKTGKRGAEAAASALPAESMANTVAAISRDALSALTNLGYGRQEAYLAIQRVLVDSDTHALSLSDVIRLGLKELVNA